ncbi:MAG TPA: bifunctional phosphopantothenoylcysteine decarboxylase/phosphopantothenate--cysteine ligase CoaBC [Vicinamibacteria bacterium]|nr:bifunctional phosphopantothenoylcysteine decarboxylase/phosphopantothenate--cysteine ligase CoaBC [Vicinamibacteria bacterium]
MATVVLGVTGCIGAYKACEVLRELQKRGVDVHVVMTQNAARFVSPMTFEALSRHPVFLDQFALGMEGDIRHISLADSADLLLVAPATANCLGKFARGIADDALSTLYTATKAPVLVAPAMNVNMFEHPAVVENMDALRRRGVRFVDPGAGYLACGWLGKGRLAEPADIVAAAMSMLARRSDLEGQSVLVTAGPTVEDIDPVRFVSNRSSGRMGYRLAEAARNRGARVVLVSGPTSLADPTGVETVRVRSAAEMAEAVEKRAADAAIVAMAAAVSDWRPAAVAPQKVKKRDGALSLEMERTADILKRLGAAKGSRFLIGFAAETNGVREYARRKLVEKNLDLIVANDVSKRGQGFAVETNAALLIDPKGEIAVPVVDKRELSERIWDRVVELRAGRTPARAERFREARSQRKPATEPRRPGRKRH